jgi:hypothetical protein
MYEPGANKIDLLLPHARCDISGDFVGDTWACKHGRESKGAADKSGEETGTSQTSRHLSGRAGRMGINIVEV